MPHPQKIFKRLSMGDMPHNFEAQMKQAVMFDNIQEIQNLLNSGMSANVALGIRNNRGVIEEVSPLTVAAKYNNVAAAECLLKNGADVNNGIFINGNHVAKPLHLAIVKNNIQVAWLLLQWGAELSNIVEDGVTTTPLDLAKNGRFEKIVQLLEQVIEYDATRLMGCGSELVHDHQVE